MCNRYRARDPAAIVAMLKKLWGIEIDLGLPRYNIAPNQVLPIVVTGENSQPAVEMARWNLVPAFEAGGGSEYLRTNARAEDVLTKPSYRQGIQRRRCVVPADGFYEWEHLHGARIKLPWAFELASGAPFSFAGICEQGTETRPPSFTILTTTPNALVARVHHRMPVLLSDRDAQQWLIPGALTKELLEPFVKPFSPEKMRSYRVNPALNSVRNDTANAAAPHVEPDAGAFQLSFD